VAIWVTSQVLSIRRHRSVVRHQPTLRFVVTLIFRRKDGEWKEIHRHADPIPGIHSTHEQLNRFR